jgi:hypothetical protein
MMTANRAHKEFQKPRVQRQAILNNSESEEILSRKNFQQASVADLQHLLGNQGVQTLLAKGKLSGLAGVQTRRAAAQHGAVQWSIGQSIQRCADCGDEPIQRFWDDEEERGESQSESSGGGIWDTVSNAASGAANFVGETAGAAANAASDLVSDTANQAADTTGRVVNSARETVNGAIDSVTNFVSDTAQSVGEWASETFGGGESAQNRTDAASPTEVTGSGDSVSSADASCETEEGIGYGSGTGVSVSLHGKTVANYDHGKPYPKTFPAGTTVKRYEIGKTKVFDASGNVDATFKANPSISLPPVPGGLSECQAEAVKNFINGDLAAHEQDHADAFTNNYDGTVSVAFSFKAIPASKEAEALQSAIEKEDVSRINTANAASAKLDPWKKTIPGLDCDE